ncbi:MAG: type II secretion system protein [Planctomycetota bacterium]|jgi:type II secretory pathway pseudopilin PulG
MQAKIYNTSYARDLRGAGSNEARMQAGVTLIEMLIVLAVIMLLVSIAIGVATSVQNQGRERLIKNTFGLLEGALQEYHDFNDVFPEQPELNFANAAAHSEILYGELNRIPASRKILQELDDSVIKDSVPPTGSMKIYDPWSIVLDYRYDRAVDTFPVLTSAGPDRKFETPEDNITNR